MDYRTPDQYYSEQLIDNNQINGQISVQSNELERCLEISMIEYIEKSMIEHELKYSNLYSKYKQILLKYEKLNKYDSSIRDFTSYIEPIMHEYCQNGQSIEVDIKTYTNILGIINSIRLNTEEKELMHQLFSKK